MIIHLQLDIFVGSSLLSLSPFMGLLKKPIDIALDLIKTRLEVSFKKGKKRCKSAKLKAQNRARKIVKSK